MFSRILLRRSVLTTVQRAFGNSRAKPIVKTGPVDDSRSVLKHEDLVTPVEFIIREMFMDAKENMGKPPNQWLNPVPDPVWRQRQRKFVRTMITGVKASVVVVLAGLVEFVRRKRKQNLLTGKKQLVIVPEGDKNVVQGTPPDELIPEPTVLGHSWTVAMRRFAWNNAFWRADGLLLAARAAGVHLSSEQTEKLNNPVRKMVAETVDFTHSVKSSLQPGKGNVFASFKDLVPVTFFGVQTHLFIKTGAMRSVPSPWLLPPADTDTRRWSALSGLKLHGDGTNPNSVSVSTDCDIRWPGCLTYTMADIRLCDGHFNFEACTRFSDDRVHMSMVGQVANWSRLVAARYDVLYLWPYSTMSVSVKPKDHACSVQFLKSLTNRLTAGIKLAYKRDELHCNSPWTDMNQFNAAMKFKYAGPSFILSGKVAPRDTAKLAFYHHHSERLQAGTMVEYSSCLSKTTTRLAFRVMSDTSSVFRAAVGTDGVINSLWEKRLDDYLSISLSVYVNYANTDHGAGIGLSFNY